MQTLEKTNGLSANQTPYYKETGREIELFKTCYSRGLPVLLKGPTGSGKTRFIEYMAHRLGLKLYTISCHEESSAVDLIGRYIIKGENTVWQDGPVTRAVREGSLVYVDEIAEARPDTIVALHSLTDHRRSLFIERTNETLQAPRSFMLAASYNPGYQGLGREIKPSTKQRYVNISFSYPDEKRETEIIQKESDCDIKTAVCLAALGKKLRNLNELSMLESVSTRILVNTALLIKDGIPPRLSCEMGIVQPLSDDGDVISSLKSLVSLYF